jgi:DNA-binding MarR family transcriptional regulator
MSKHTHRTRVFVSYCHRDERWLKRLQVHLAPYVRRGDVDLWDDTKITPGELWRPAIRDAIDRAVAAVLLISADFLASEFIVAEELPPLLDRAEKRGARIFVLVVRPCTLDAHPKIASYQALNQPDKPLSSMKPSSKAEDVLARVSAQIAHLIGGPSRVDRKVNGGLRTFDTDGERLFEDLQFAAVVLSILDALVGRNGDPPAYTISDLTRVLNIRSRRLGYCAVERLLVAGWVEKRRSDRIHTTFSITPEGVRQLQLLTAASDGPLRRTR